VSAPGQRNLPPSNFFEDISPFDPDAQLEERICQLVESDHRGRYLREIQEWPDDQLESVPDYIQWLFPLPEPSGFNVAAPALTRESILDFLARPDLQEILRVSFLRFDELLWT